MLDLYLMNLMSCRTGLFRAGRYLAIVVIFSLLGSAPLSTLAQSSASPSLTSLFSQPTQAAPVDYTQAEPEAYTAPFDLFNEPIDTLLIYRWYERTANQLLEQPGAEAAALALQEQVRNAPMQSMVQLAGLQATARTEGDSIYQHMVKSSLYIGEMYDCGRCARIHASYAGGVLISEDGLALTNHHVIETRENGAKGIFAMTYDGRVWPIVEVLAASKKDDVALVRLGTGDSGHRFHAAALAGVEPQPTDAVRIISHPYGEFYVMTTGEVSRYSRQKKPRDGVDPDLPRGTWMEVTAAFGQGSSGSGVFNSSGEVVGLVSTIVPLVRKAPNENEQQQEADQSQPKSGQDDFVELLLRQCVPLEAIRNQFVR